MLESPDLKAKVKLIFIRPEEARVLFGTATPIEDRTKILNDMAIRIYNTAVENTLLSLPDTMAYLAKNAVDTHRVRSEFINRWKGKIKDPEAVARMINGIETNNTDWSMEQILNEATRLLSRPTELVKEQGVVDEGTARTILGGK